MYILSNQTLIGYSNIPHSNDRMQSMHFCVYIAINVFKSEEYIIILVIKVIVGWLGSSEKVNQLLCLSHGDMVCMQLTIWSASHMVNHDINNFIQL